MSDRYILYTATCKTEYDTFDQAKEAFDNCEDFLRFLYPLSSHM